MKKERFELKQVFEAMQKGMEMEVKQPKKEITSLNPDAFKNAEMEKKYAGRVM